MSVANQSRPIQPTFGDRARAALQQQEIILLILLIVVVLILATQSENFLTTANLLNQGRLFAEIALIALPMTYIIITGGIDLSVGSIFGLSAIMLGYSWQNWGWALEAAIVFSLIVGTICGFVNGVLITKIGLPPLITTLATLALYRGLAQGISQARSARGFPDWFFQMGQYDLAGVPTQLWVLLIAILIFGIILSTTVFGRSLYAIGNNEIGSRFSGLPVDRYKLWIYTLSGLISGLAAWIYVSRINTTRSDMGSGHELEAIAAVVLGGTSIFGGSGSIWGTVIGAVLIQLLKNGLSLAGIKTDATSVVIGVVLIAAILINTALQRRAQRD